MKKDRNSVDELFRDSLQNHKVTPSDAARSRFLDEAAPPGGAGVNKFFRWYKMLAVAAVITASVLLYFYFSHNNTLAPEKIDIQPLSGLNNTTAPEIESVTPEKSIANANQDNNINITENLSDKKNAEDITVRNLNIRNTDKAGNTNTVIASNTKHETETVDSKSDQIKKTGIQEDENVIPEPKVESSTQAALIPKPVGDLVTQPADSTANVDDVSGIPQAADEPQPQPLPELKQSTFDFTPYLLYSMDWNFKSNGNGLVHTLGFEGKVQYGRFSLISGIGITSTKGTSDYEVEYNDYLGKYRKLDSITFAYDQKQYYLEPTYYMSDIEVWDSIIKLDSYQEEMRYNHMRIPILFGYDILSRGRFVLGIKTGVEMNFYLKSRNLTNYEYSAGQNKLVSVNQINDPIARNKYMLMANLSAACNLTRRIVLEVEPRIQYILNQDKSAESSENQEVFPSIRSSLKIKF
jgi:hypothetical protein